MILMLLNCHPELLKLKADLEQVIDLTKTLVAQSVAKASQKEEEEEEEDTEPGWFATEI